MLARKAAAAETLIVCHSASAKPAAHKPNGSVLCGHCFGHLTPLPPQRLGWRIVAGLP
jgi:hypothetical protein